MAATATVEHGEVRRTPNLLAPAGRLALLLAVTSVATHVALLGVDHAEPLWVIGFVVMALGCAGCATKVWRHTLSARTWATIAAMYAAMLVVHPLMPMPDTGGPSMRSGMAQMPGMDMPGMEMGGMSMSVQHGSSLTMPLMHLASGIATAQIMLALLALAALARMARAR